jgi:hypothetical protein
MYLHQIVFFINTIYHKRGKKNKHKHKDENKNENENEYKNYHSSKKGKEEQAQAQAQVQELSQLTRIKLLSIHISLKDNINSNNFYDSASTVHVVISI